MERENNENSWHLLGPYYKGALIHSIIGLIAIIVFTQLFTIYNSIIIIFSILFLSTIGISIRLYNLAGNGVEKEYILNNNFRIESLVPYLFEFCKYKNVEIENIKQPIISLIYLGRSHAFNIKRESIKVFLIYSFRTKKIRIIITNTNFNLENLFDSWIVLLNTRLISDYRNTTLVPPTIFP